MHISLTITALNAWLISLVANVDSVRIQILSQPKKKTKANKNPVACLCPEKWGILLFYNDTLSQINKARCDNKTLI